jgi:hypothetical protein
LVVYAQIIGGLPLRDPEEDRTEDPEEDLSVKGILEWGIIPIPPTHQGASL